MKENHRSNFMASASQELISKVIFFSVALAFTFLGYSLQFNTIPQSTVGFWLLVFSWVSLLISGLLGLLSAHNFASFTMESKSLWDLKAEYEEEKEKDNPDQDFLDAMEAKSKMQTSSARANMKKHFWNRRAHLVLMVSGLIAFGVTKSIDLQGQVPVFEKSGINNDIKVIDTSSVVGVIPVYQADCELYIRNTLEKRQIIPSATKDVIYAKSHNKHDDSIYEQVCDLSALDVSKAKTEN